MKNSDSVPQIELSQNVFPLEFPDVGGWTFERVAKERTDFCDFMLNGVTKATGTFKIFREYLKNIQWTRSRKF